MPGSVFELLNPPANVVQFSKELLDRAKGLGAEGPGLPGSYQEFKRGTPEDRAQYDKAIARLREVGRPPEDARYGVSVTERAKPFQMTAPELIAIAHNEGLASQIFSNTTGRNPTQRELESFMLRANKTLQHIPDNVLESIPSSPQYNELNARKHNDYLDLQKQIEETPRRINPYLSQHESIAKSLREAQDVLRPPEALDENEKFSQHKYWGARGELSREEAQKRLDEDKIQHSARSASHLIMKPFPEEIPYLKQIEQETLALRKRMEPLQEGHRLFEENQRQQQAIERGERPPLVPQEEFRYLLERASAPRLEEEEASKLQRVAPRNALHEQAHDIVQGSLNNNGMDRAQEQLARSNDENIIERMAPYLNAGNRDPREAMNLFAHEYADDFERNYMEKAINDAERVFNEKVLPKINYSFAGQGAFNSGARNKKIDEVRKEISRELGEKQKLLQADLRREGMNRASDLFNKTQDRALNSAQLVGAGAQNQQQHHRGLAEGHRQQAVTNTTLGQSQAGMLEQIATAQQQQAQNKINSELAQQRAKEMHPWENLARQHAIVGGLPFPQERATFDVGAVPQGANPYQGLSGLIGGVSQAMNRHASGGPVRARFAGGGAVDDYTKYKNLQEQQAQAYAGQLRGKQAPNPGLTMMEHFGQEVLKSSPDRFHQAWGRSMESGRNAIDKSRLEMENAQDKAFNMDQAINESRFKQHEFLTKLGQNERQFRDTLGQKERHHKDNIGLRMNSMQTKEKETSIGRIKLIKEAREKLLKGQTLRDEATHLAELSKKAETGPLAGFINEWTPYKSENQNNLEMAAEAAAINRLSAQKRPSIAVLETIQRSKPNVRNYPKANELGTKQHTKEGDDITREGIAIMESLGMTPDEIKEELSKIKPHKISDDKSEEAEGKVRIRNKKTGKVIRVNANEAQEYIDDGGEIV